MTSYNKHDSQNLFIAENRLYTLFGKARAGLPPLVIGHHSKEYFHPEEQSRLSGLFQDRVDMYLCGHSYRANYASFDIAPHEVHQITCGCGVVDGYSKLVFMCNTPTRRISVTPYSYAESGDQSYEYAFRIFALDTTWCSCVKSYG